MPLNRQNGGLEWVPTPKLVTQSDEAGNIRSVCWAASLASWISAARVRNVDIKWVLGTFRASLTKVSSSDDAKAGSLDLGRLDDVTEHPDVRMDYDDWQNSSAMTKDYFWDALTWSPLYVLFNSSDTMMHAVCVYGIRPDQQDGWDLRMMDPLFGYRIGSVAEFQKRGTRFLVAFMKGRYGPPQILNYEAFPGG